MALTVTPLVDTAETMMYVTMQLVSAPKDVKLTGRETSVIYAATGFMVLIVKAHVDTVETMTCVTMSQATVLMDVRVTGRGAVVMFVRMGIITTTAQVNVVIVLEISRVINAMEHV